MSKIKLLLDVVSDMRSLADSIEVVCKAMTESDATPEEMPATKSDKANEQDIPLEKVRMVLAEKSQLGFTAQMREIIGKYGADKLSAVDKAYYADILKDAEVLGNG